MTDTGAHQGVKSLLARFENNHQNVISPPSRDRSPAGSDNLSKVRASFIAVEKGSQPSPILGVRRINSHSESPPPPFRAKSFSSDDVDGSVKSNRSSSQTTNGLGGAERVNEVEKEDSVPEIVDTKGKQKAEETTSPAINEIQPSPKSSTVAPGSSTAKLTKTVTKRPSNVHIGKTGSTSKPASHVSSSKSSTQLRTPPSASKPDSETAFRVTRVSRPSTNTSGKNDLPKAPVHKPSRSSLTTTTKTSTRPPRAPTPAREITRLAPRTSDVRSTSTSRPARLPASSTVPSLTSAARLSATGVATLSRKPSNLKGTGSGAHRATTPTASSVRKQTSRSPPGKSGSNRSHSRASTTTKLVDEGFLARMMRPTASSASKAHEKVEVKSPPQPIVARAPRRVPSKPDTRSARPLKEKIPFEKLRDETKRSAEKPVGSRPKGEEQKTEFVREDITEQPVSEVPVEPSDQSPQPAVDLDKPLDEAPAEPHVESSSEPVVNTAENQRKDEAGDTKATQSEETVTELATSLEADEQAESAEAFVELTPESPEEKGSAPAEKAVEQATEPANPATTEVVEKVDTDHSEAAPAFPRGVSEDPIEGALETDQKPDEVDVDIGKLTLNDKETSS